MLNQINSEKLLRLIWYIFALLVWMTQLDTESRRLLKLLDMDIKMLLRTKIHQVKSTSEWSLVIILKLQSKLLSNVELRGKMKLNLIKLLWLESNLEKQLEDILRFGIQNIMNTGLISWKKLVMVIKLHLMLSKEDWRLSLEQLVKIDSSWLLVSSKKVDS